MLRVLLSMIFALAITIATAWINPVTDEMAMYGHEGPIGHNWLPREVAGWPAPFLADNPGTSVLHKVGMEDVFRPGSFIATLSFWFLAVLAAGRLGRLTKRKTHGQRHRKRPARNGAF